MMKILAVLIFIVGVSSALKIQNVCDAEKSTISVKLLTNLKNTTTNLVMVNNVVAVMKNLQPTVAASTTTTVTQINTKIAVEIEIAQTAATCSDVTDFFDQLNTKYQEIVGILVNCGNEVDIIV